MASPSLNRFKHHTVIITGSAHGIGRACMQRFRQEGATVIGIDSDHNANQQLVAQLNGCYDHELKMAFAFECDLSDESAVEHTFATLLSRWPTINTLICSAGIYSGQPLPQVTTAAWQQVLNTNLSALFYCNRAISHTLQQQRCGSIINISSMAGKSSFPASAQYSASKSGVIGLTRSVALDLAPFHCTANAICPGNTDTRMLRQVAEVVSARQGITPTAWLAQRQQECPMGRFADPAEIAGAAAFLASEDARYLTGQAIEIDGGMVLC
ncbi:SDR family oxidoreductase [Ectothiorhodospiraceae bacterium BW-2]|nr:SDR family oxidoreductase [Ectothiorhodospiraceae bacterium BW-2]